jgi:polar amino acid transport system substrate-binding protein
MRAQQLLLLLLAWALLGAASLATAQAPKESKTLELIRKRGAIHVGVKTDFPPFGQINGQGQAEGFEIDLAADIAKQLGVKLVTVNITTENRFQKLEQGDVDVLIATVGDTAERRQIATAIEPNYYAGGVSIFLRPGQRISDWSGMRGQKICATQGAYFNRPMSQRYLLDLVTYKGTRDALLALKDARCIGFLYSSAAIQAYLKKSEWAGYTAPLPAAMVAPWAINVSRKEADTEFDHLLGNFVAQWHRSGFLIDVEQKWGIQPIKFLKDAKAQWTQRDDQKNYICQRDDAGHWPTACRNPTFVRFNEVGGLLRLGLWLQENTGLNLTFVYDNYDRGVFLRGLGYSIVLMAGSIFLSLLLGATWAVLAESRVRWIAPVLRALAVYGRMTPPLLQMYLLFFGVGALLWTGLGVSLSAVAVAIWCMSYYTGASIMTTLLDSADHLRVQQPQFRITLSTLPWMV